MKYLFFALPLFLCACTNTDEIDSLNARLDELQTVVNELKINYEILDSACNDVTRTVDNINQRLDLIE